MNALATVPLIVFPALLVLAALKDVTSFIIPNWISAVLLVAFLPAAMATGLPWGMVAQHAAVGGVALVIGMGLFALNWIGGGDAKLFSASGLWLGLAAAPEFLIWTAVAGGAVGLGLIMARKAFVWAPVGGGVDWVRSLMDPKGDLPYGVAICAGALLAFPESGLFAAAG